MPNVSLKPEEIQSLRSFQDKYHTVTKRYGELQFQIRLLNKEVEFLEQEMDDLETSRINMMNSLQQQYGAGTIDLETGTFTPVSDEAPTQ
jgi:SMC interacting uncharacterized protein involved in chromosome segregation